MTAGGTLPYVILGIFGPAAALGGAIFGQIWSARAARRNNSGTVDTSDARTIWEQARQTIADLRLSNAELKTEVGRLHAEVLRLGDENAKLAAENGQLRAELQELGRQVGALRAELTKAGP